MAGTVIDRQLAIRPANRVHFCVAREEDDPAIRRLLRENPMRGRITLSFEREPDYFLATNLASAEDRTILAYDQNQLICMGRCFVRQRYLNGEPRRVGYLSDLRLDASARGRFDILRRGYQFFHELHSADPPDFYFTSIAADNVRSLRFLERGLPGMPAYRFLAGFVTLLIPVPTRARAVGRLLKSAQNRFDSRQIRCIAGSEVNADHIAACLNAQGRSHQLACAWTGNDLRTLEPVGLRISDFLVLMNRQRVVGCAALWDQRCFRQTVVHGYDLKWSCARPWINLGAGFAGVPGLPPAKSTLAHALLSPLAIEPDQSDLLLALIETGLPRAAERGLEFITLGFSADDPRLAMLRDRFRCREYFSRLYQVDWAVEDSKPLRNRMVCPEVALL